MVNGAVAETYGTNDMRISVVWRALCFESEAARLAHASEPRMALEGVFSRLEADLRARGVLPAGAPRPPPLDFALMLVEYYAPYAYSEAWVKTNYCVVVPSLVSSALGDAFKAVFCHRRAGA